MAHYGGIDNNLVAWDLCSHSGIKMSFRGRHLHDGMSMNSRGHYTTVDGVPVRKLFISKLAKQTLEKDLYKVFSQYGKVLEASVVKSTIETKPTFGFVTFQTPGEATCAIKNKHKLVLFGRRLFVSPADSWHQPLELPNGELVLSRRQNNHVYHNESVQSPEPDSEEAGSSTNDIIALQPDDSCAISKLNDDCLLLIFNCLPLNERLNLHLVCQRWQSLLMSMWYGVKKLDFTAYPLCKDTLNDKYLKSYISLCPNLTSINIATDDHELTSNALILIAKNCLNLEEIVIRELRMKKRTLAFLAKSCTKLKAFYNDACTSTPDTEMIGLVKNCKNLERISLKFSPSPSGLWLRFLKSPLKSLSLEMYDFESENLLMGIHESKSTLRELKFVSCDSIRSRDIEAIVTVAPDLTQLTLAGGYSDFKSHSLLPITRLKKLTRLDLDNNSFVCDQFLEELSQNCPDLQTLTLSGIDDRYLTSQGLSSLAKITGLTYLTLASVRKLTDSILKSISQKVKGLKHLGVMGCTSVTDEGCQSVVTNCKDLETFDVSGCGNVTNLTIIAAADSTRGTGRKLKIIAGDSGIDVDISCPPSIILDPASSIMAHYPGAMFILDPEFELDHDAIFNNLFLDEDIEDMSGDEDYMLFDEEQVGYVHFKCNDTDSSDGNYDDYEFIENLRLF